MSTPLPATVTPEMIAALTQAIADGVRQVSVPGLTTTYQTTASMIEALKLLETKYRDQQNAGNPAPPSRVSYYTTNGRGYD